MSFIKIAKFARFSPDGNLDLLQCKICGTVIGELQQRPIGFRERPDGRIVERIVENFVHNHLYMEAKIACTDGSHHVTNGCVKCLTGDFTEEQLEELIRTDEEEQGFEQSARKVYKIVKTLKGGGIR